MSRNLLLAAALAACPLVAVAQRSEPAPSVADIVHTRQSKMGRGGRELHAIEQATSSGAPLSAVAEPIRWLVQWSDELPTLFPEGSNGEDMGARPSVWSNPTGFAAAANRFREATRQLAEAAATDDRAAMTRRIRAVWDACEGCHADFTG